MVTTLAAVAYISERGVPLIDEDASAAALIVPAQPAHGGLRIPLDGPEHVSVGTVITLNGAVPLEHGRIILVKARWNGGAWQGLHAAQAADDGSFRVKYALDRQGTAQIRILFPGRRGFAYKWYRVTSPSR